MISVLITTFNNGNYLKTAIESCLSQEFKDFELLIIDDGSDDNTESIVKSFNDCRIVYKKIGHSGRSTALNFGLKTCKYDWVTLADADDLMLPNKLSEYSNFINHSENTIVGCWVKYFNEANKIIFSLKPPIKSNEILHELKLHSIIPNSTLYNRNFILKNGGYNEKYIVAEDYELWLRLRNISNFIIIPKYLTLMRFRNNSLSNVSYKNMKKNVYNLQKSIYLENDSFDFPIEIRGWREFFYGDKNEARVIWKKLDIIKLITPRILIAYLLTYLPEEIFEKIKSLRIKLRLFNFIERLTFRNFIYNKFLTKYK